MLLYMSSEFLWEMRNFLFLQPYNMSRSELMKKKKQSTTLMHYESCIKHNNIVQLEVHDYIHYI